MPLYIKPTFQGDRRGQWKINKSERWVREVSDTTKFNKKANDRKSRYTQAYFWEIAKKINMKSQDQKNIFFFNVFREIYQKLCFSGSATSFFLSAIHQSISTREGSQILFSWGYDPVVGGWSTSIKKWKWKLFQIQDYFKALTSQGPYTASILQCTHSYNTCT